MIPTIEDTIALVKRLYDQELITSAGIRDSLLTKLEVAQTSYDRGNLTSAVNQIGAFCNETKAQMSKYITLEAAEALLAYAGTLLFQINLDKARIEAIARIERETKKAKEKIQKKKD
ncbi:unnamed protein product, partial [marine sediment metagenome]